VISESSNDRAGHAVLGGVGRGVGLSGWSQ
jgi:hypothetical protein